MEKLSSGPIKILLADDDSDDREFFQEALSIAESDALLTTMEDGEKLLRYLDLEEKSPDIIFLDINMPFKNGKECLKEIRSNKKYELMPVVMFSTSSSLIDIDETFTGGADLYVSKPVFFKDEVNILKKILLLKKQKDLLKPDKKKFVMHTESYLV